MRARMIAMGCAMVLAATVAGCGGDGADSSEDDLTGTVLKEGSPEALAVLALVNDPKVDAGVLKSGAGVDSRAVTGIIGHRDGPDGAAQTEDDDLFDDVAELDAVKWVGPTALGKLLAYAKAHGYLASGGKKLEVVFSPQAYDQSHAAKVAKTIDTAKSTLDIAMYSFSDATIQKALQAAVARGVKVRFVFETANADHGLTGSALESSKSGQLEKLGVNVRWVNKIMHHKFMIVDGPRDDAATAQTAQVVSGSANWSNGAATKYDENTMFLSGYPELTLRLQREFNLLWEHSQDIAVNASLPYELSTLAIGDDAIPDEANTDILFTSSNFTVKGTTFSVTGKNTIADAWVAAIQGAKKSIHISSGHMRSRPVAEALMAKIKDSPDLDVRVYLDDQEYISQASEAAQKSDLDACLAAAGTSESKKRECLDKGFLYGLEVGESGIDVRYKFYAYRWDASYAAQMHHKYMVVDGAELYTGSYNLSDNAEHQTFENMFVYKGSEFSAFVKQYEDNFEHIWETGRAEGKLASLSDKVKNDTTIPIVFDPMALSWQEVTDLKTLIRTNCPDVDSSPYRTAAASHQTCTKH